MPADKGWSRRFVDPIPPGWKTSGRHAIWLIRKHPGSIGMRVVCAAAMIVMLAWPAYAQDNHVPRYGEEDKEKSAVEKQADKAAERAYERSLGNIPDKGGSTDPWGIARSTDAPKAAAKTPAAKKPPAKTGSTAN
jgi:hypothetical protein